MKATLMSICCWIVVMQVSIAQDLTLSMPHKLVSEDDVVAIDILTLDFDSIVSTQFSLKWDPNVIAFENAETVDLDLVAVGSGNADSGSLRVSWFDINGQGKDLMDGQVFLRLHFLAVGQVGDRSSIEINGDSLEVQVFKATDTPFIYDEIALIAENGSVEIISESNPLNTFSLTDIIISDVPCNGSEVGAIQLESNQQNVNYQWTGPNGYMSAEQNIDNLMGGEYMLSVLDENGAAIFDTTFVITEPIASLSIEEINSAPSACDEATGSAIFTITGGTSPYTLTFENGNQFSESLVPMLSSGSYPISISDNNGCTITAEFIVGQLDTIPFSLGPDISTCDGEVVNIAAGNFASYMWSTLSTDNEIDAVSAGSYSVTVTNDFGCTATDSITINYVDSIQLQLSQDNITICPGDSVVLSVTGGTTYQWMDADGELLETQGGAALVHPDEDEIFTVISDSSCGTDALEIPVHVFRTTATAGANVCVPTGESVRLNASGGDFYYWSGSEYPLSAYDIPNPSVAPEDSTKYFVMIIDENDCTTFDTVTVFVADDPRSFIPHINFISPNGDGQNDVLDFGEIGKFGPNTFRVFNRWGKIVYEKINYQSDNARFSGVYKGKKLPAGNYYYVLSFVNDQQIKQTLTIVNK